MKSVAYLSGLLILLMALLSSQTGCSTLNQTTSEHQRLYDVILKHDIATIPDDIDYMLFMERPTHLSKWLIEY